MEVHFLQTTLKLTVNLAKSKVAPVGECSFLGFVIVGKKIRWTDWQPTQCTDGPPTIAGNRLRIGLVHWLV